MMLLALALATMPQPIGGPVATDLTGLSGLVAETRPASTRVELTVDAAGRPVRCDVPVPGGAPTLDRAACAYLMRRARFAPARDGGGNPVAAVVRRDFTANGVPPEPSPVDFAVAVDALPGRDRLAVVDLLVMTDAGGRVGSCAVAAPGRVVQLDRLACREVAATSFAPARDRAETAVPALRQVSVGFTAAEVPR